MRVLEVTQGLGRGGAERALLQRLVHAPEYFESTIVNLRPELDELHSDKAKVVKFTGGWLRQRFFLRNLVLKDAPDFVIIRTPKDLLNVASWSSRRRRRFRLVYEAHSEVASERTGLLAWVIAKLVQVANSRVDLHIAVSQRVASGELCSDSRQVVVHYLGATVDESVRGILPPVVGVRFIFVGRFVRLKRPEWLVSCVRDLAMEFRKTKSVLTMVGDGPLKTTLQGNLRQWDLDDIVEIIGPIEAPEEAMKTSDVLVIASLREGLPLTVFEAKLMGLRILTTPAGGTAEVLDSEDRVVRDFGKPAFIDALRAELERGPQSDEQRFTILNRSLRFASAKSVSGFYNLLDRS
jgi:glycosyltransferase involved in cell wall biosynthesis